MILHPNNDEYCPTCNLAMCSDEDTPHIVDCANGHRFRRVNAFATIDNKEQETWTEELLCDYINEALLHECDSFSSQE